MASPNVSKSKDWSCWNGSGQLLRGTFHVSQCKLAQTMAFVNVHCVRTWHASLILVRGEYFLQEIKICHTCVLIISEDAEVTFACIVPECCSCKLHKLEASRNLGAVCLSTTFSSHKKKEQQKLCCCCPAYAFVLRGRHMYCYELVASTNNTSSSF